MDEKQYAAADPRKLRAISPSTLSTQSLRSGTIAICEGEQSRTVTTDGSDEAPLPDSLDAEPMAREPCTVEATKPVEQAGNEDEDVEVAESNTSSSAGGITADDGLETGSENPKHRVETPEHTSETPEHRSETPDQDAFVDLEAQDGKDDTVHTLIAISEPSTGTETIFSSYGETRREGSLETDCSTAPDAISAAGEANHQSVPLVADSCSPPEAAISIQFHTLAAPCDDHAYGETSRAQSMPSLPIIECGQNPLSAEGGCKIEVNTAPLKESVQRPARRNSIQIGCISTEEKETPDRPTSPCSDNSCPAPPVCVRNTSWRRSSTRSTKSAKSTSSNEKSPRARGTGKFTKDDLEAAKTSRHHIRRSSLHMEEAEFDITQGMLDSVLEEERKRLGSKVVSRAFENDLNQLHSERALLSKRAKGKSHHSVVPVAVSPTLLRSPTMASVGSASMSSLPTSTLIEKMTHYLGWVRPIKWVATAVIAFIIAMQASAIILGAYHLGLWKFDVLATLCASGHLGHLYAFIFLLLYAVPAGFISAVLVTYLAPHAGGSGIPELKSYLNGISFPHAFSLKTWISRSIGLVLVTSAGLFAGTEGPFAHLGAIVASGMAEGPGWHRFSWPSILSGHRNRCEFISQGAAMGVAAAFGAPIGGILFSLEEASTYWSKALTWQAFFGTMISAAVAKLIKSGFTDISGGGFIEFPDKNASFQIWELFSFGIMAGTLGLLGALFCYLVKRCMSFRWQLFELASPSSTSRKARVLEVLCVIIFSTSICFWPSVFAGCQGLDGHTLSERRSLSGGGGNVNPDLSGGICSEDSYSDIGYLLLQPKEAAIKALFSHNMQSGAVLKIPSLIICYLIIFGTTVITFGSAIPVGLFIPNILAGACFGRAVGQAFLEVGVAVRPDVYALMGAAAALAAFSRMTISLGVIFVEITNNTYLGVPLMLVIMVSKIVADLFIPSVIDIVLDLNPNIHLLEDNLSEDHFLVLQSFTAHDVCTAEVVVLREEEPLSQVISLVMRTSFAGFPVVDAQNRLTGFVTRTQLSSVLHLARARSKGKVMNGNITVKISPLSETPPEITMWDTPAVRSFHHFRALGLQHLCVVGQSHELLGILTRTDFSRLCAHGPEGVEYVRILMERKYKDMEKWAESEAFDCDDIDIMSSLSAASSTSGHNPSGIGEDILIDNAAGG